MYRVHIWLRRRDGMSAEEFHEYWLTKHAPIVRDGYANLRAYELHTVTRVPGDGEAPYDGVAVLSWDSREDFKADVASDAAKAATEDMANFADGSGVLFVDVDIVK
jgi:uncharacterized protein (TIGR02118 family)